MNLFTPLRVGTGALARHQWCPTGKSPKVCPDLRAKIFRWRRRANQEFNLARLAATRGAIAIVTTVRWDAVDAKAATDERGKSVR